jgi:hypothetical protein
MERQFNNVELQFLDPEARATLLVAGQSVADTTAEMMLLPLQDAQLRAPQSQVFGAVYQPGETPPLVRLLGSNEGAGRPRVKQRIRQRR